MSSVELVGYVAATLTTTAFFPQVIKTYKSKDTKSISLSMYAVLTLGIILWLIYGLYLNSYPIILANAVTLIAVLYIIIMKIKHK